MEDVMFFRCTSEPLVVTREDILMILSSHLYDLYVILICLPFKEKTLKLHCESPHNCSEKNRALLKDVCVTHIQLHTILKLCSHLETLHLCEVWLNTDTSSRFDYSVSSVGYGSRWGKWAIESLNLCIIFSADSNVNYLISDSCCYLLQVKKPFSTRSEWEKTDRGRFHKAEPF